MSAPIERDYLEVFREIVTPSAWRTTVQKALDDAGEGNSQARAWITRLVLGSQPMTLTGLAVRESLGISGFGEVEALAWGSVEFEGEDARAAVGLNEGMSISLAQKETAKAERRARRQAKQLAAGQPEASTDR